MDDEEVTRRVDECTPKSAEGMRLYVASHCPVRLYRERIEQRLFSEYKVFSTQNIKLTRTLGQKTVECDS